MGRLLGTIKIREKGVVTIPSEVRQLLKISQGDKLALVLKDGEIIIKRAKEGYEDFDL